MALPCAIVGKLMLVFDQEIRVEIVERTQMQADPFVWTRRALMPKNTRLRNRWRPT
jgi:hypothetical protein